MSMNIQIENDQHTTPVIVELNDLLASFDDKHELMSHG